jgi:hypothetical protein
MLPPAKKERNLFSLKFKNVSLMFPMNISKSLVFSLLLSLFFFFCDGLPTDHTESVESDDIQEQSTNLNHLPADV